MATMVNFLAETRAAAEARRTAENFIVKRVWL
jgi:hypothetical protein